MKKLNLIITLLIIFLISGCNSEDENARIGENNETLIFGWFADSNCNGACSSIYKIENGKIYKDIDYNDTKDTFFKGNFQLMENTDYENFKALLFELPKEIINKPNGYLDCSSCTSNHGGFYLELKNDNGLHKSWRFHNVSHPNYIKNYRSILISKLEKLNG